MFTQSTGCKQSEVTGNICRVKALICVVLRLLCCITSGDVILTSFLSSLFESEKLELERHTDGHTKAPE